MPQFGDDIYLGPAYVGGQGPVPLLPDGTTDIEPSLMDVGVGPMGRIYVFDLVPATASATAIVNAQAVAGAGVVTQVSPTVTLDRTGRCLVFVSSNAGDTTQTITVVGRDMYNNVMTETKTLNGTTPVNGIKAFYQVTSVTASGVMTGNLSVGTRDAYGLPLRVNDAGYLASVKWDGVLAQNAGTFVAAVSTTATALTGDVRGTYAQSGNAANGVRRLVIGVLVTGLQAGPNATRAGAFGVAQF